MKRQIVVIVSLLCALVCVCAGAQDKVPLGQPDQVKVALDEPKASDLATQLKDMPDGVLKVKTNDDGSFKSLVVKSTVEIEDVLGGEKGKRMARKEAEIQCKRSLSQWLDENCVFVEGSDKSTSIITKGESSKDAAGNTVKIRSQEGKEIKAMTENHASLSKATLRGMIVLHSAVTESTPPQYELIMGLSQDTLAQAASVKATLSGETKPLAQPPTAAEKATAASPADDTPKPEKKTNPDAKDFM